MVDHVPGSNRSIEEAAAQLIQLLDRLPAFEPCHGTAEEWDEHLRNRLLPIWDVLPEYLRSLPTKDLMASWWAYGDGRILHVPPSLCAVHLAAPESKMPHKQAAVQRVLAARASNVPDKVRKTIFSSWGDIPWIKGLEPEVIVRNEWHERRCLVASVRDEMNRLVPLAVRAVERARMDKQPVLALLMDDTLDTELVDAAIAQIIQAVPQRPGAATAESPTKTATAQQPPTSLRGFDAGTVATRLSDLAGEFEDCVRYLRSRPENPILISEIRSLLAESGHRLCQLLHHGLVDRPRQLPPWLRWRTPSAGPRPYFRGYNGLPVRESWTPKRSVRQLIGVLASAQRVFDKGTERKASELKATSFHRRHIFIEAVTGWLGQRCQPRVTAFAPAGQAVLHTSDEEHLANPNKEDTVDVVVDWVGAPIAEQVLVFLELGRAAAAVCRHLATTIGRSIVPTQQARKPVAASVDEPPPSRDGTILKPPRKLTGWKEILPAVGIDDKDRRKREILKRLNSDTGGPITNLGRIAVVDEAELASWWSRVTAAADASSGGTSDRDRRGTAAELENHGARKDQGFHVKTSPNKRRRLPS